jgi:hypothetical protein
MPAQLRITALPLSLSSALPRLYLIDRDRRADLAMLVSAALALLAAASVVALREH